MLKIRFFRVGKKGQPAFKIVVTEKEKSSTRGSFVEEVGFYNPLTKEKVLREERIKYWLSVGAQPSNTVHNLLVASGVLEGKKVDVHNKPEKLKEEKSSSRPSPSQEGLEKEEKPTEAPVQAAVPLEKPEEKAAEKPAELVKKEQPVEEAPSPEEKKPEAETPQEKPTEAPKEEPKTTE